MLQGTVALGGQLNDLSIQTGMSGEALQEWGYIAKLNGSSLEEFTGVVKRLQRGINDAAATGTGPLSDAFKTLGVSAKDVKADLAHGGSLDGVLMKVADKFPGFSRGSKVTS